MKPHDSELRATREVLRVTLGLAVANQLVEDVAGRFLKQLTDEIDGAYHDFSIPLCGGESLDDAFDSLASTEGFVNLAFRTTVWSKSEGR